MKNLALNKDLVSSGITFNTVAPGCIMIPNTGWEKEKNNNPSEFKKMVENNFPLGRLGRPDEVAYAIVMLLLLLMVVISTFLNHLLFINIEPLSALYIIILYR